MRVIERKLLLREGIGAHHDVGELQIADANTVGREFHSAAAVGGGVALDGSDIERGRLSEESGGEDERDGASQHLSHLNKSGGGGVGRYPACLYRYQTR